MRDKKNAAAGERGGTTNTTNYSADNTNANAQRQRLLAALIVGEVSTFYARDQLNILMPAARIKELRNQGHDISTFRITIDDGYGRTHNGVARYVLVKLAGVVK